jgi:hypothetical protein
MSCTNRASYRRLNLTLACADITKEMESKRERKRERESKRERKRERERERERKRERERERVWGRQTGEYFVSGVLLLDCVGVVLLLDCVYKHVYI